MPDPQMTFQRPRGAQASAVCRPIQEHYSGLKVHVRHPGEQMNGSLPCVQGSEFCKYSDFGERVDSVEISGLARLLNRLERSQLTIFSNSKEAPSKKFVISITMTWNTAQIERKISLEHVQI